MYFHGNQHLWAIKHPFVSLYSKYQFLQFICLPVMNSPVFPSLDDIYCMSQVGHLLRRSATLYCIYIFTSRILVDRFAIRRFVKRAIAIASAVRTTASASPRRIRPMTSSPADASANATSAAKDATDAKRASGIDASTIQMDAKTAGDVKLIVVSFQLTANFFQFIETIMNKL